MAAHVRSSRVALPVLFAALLLLFICVLAPGAAAQTTTSTIEGTVADASGAVVPGAEIRVTGTTLSAERTSTSDANGFYRVTALPAGNYTLSIAAKGFATRAVTLEVTLNRVIVFDVTLEVGGLAADRPANNRSLASSFSSVCMLSI